ncbi:oxidoreductase [Clostridioides difficile]|nr:oxidoreductase [Clostridioides difficile]
MNQEYVKGKPIFTNINKIPRQFPYLTDDIDTDVIIVGGGVTGCICAYYLAKNNIKSVILEKERIAHGSTSVTTSLLQYELDDNLIDLTEVMTLKDALKAYNLCASALEELDTFIELYGNKCDYARRDTLLYTANKLEIKAIKEEYNLRKENGFDVEYIDESTNPFSFDLKSGLIAKNGGRELDPYKYSHHLIDVSLKNGLQVYENTEVKKVDLSNDKVTAEVSYGYKVHGKKLIVATGYNTSLFTKRNFATKSNTFNIATKPLKNIASWKNNILIRDNCDPYNYLRTTKDNRLIIGGEDVSFDDIEDETLANEKYDILEQRLKSMFKDIKDIEVEYKYCGCFASTLDNLGFIGPDNKNNNLWYCLGYGANGILFAILGGIMLSELYLGKQNKNMKLFKVDRFDK